MSLDVYLKLPGQSTTPGSGISIREDGQIREISREEWDARYPNREPVVCPVRETDTVFHANLTHNLAKMAKEAGLYTVCWHPEDLGFNKAAQLIPLLTEGLTRLVTESSHFHTFNPANGWGNYDRFVLWLIDYLAACKRYPDADVSTDT